MIKLMTAMMAMIRLMMTMVKKERNLRKVMAMTAPAAAVLTSDPTTHKFQLKVQTCHVGMLPSCDRTDVTVASDAA